MLRRHSVLPVLSHCSRQRLTRNGLHTVPRKGDKVVVGMSGGVDSSVTASLLAREDYDLSAVYMRNWDTRDEYANDKGCEWEKDWDDVQRVCKLLGLPCELIDLSQHYWNRVFEPSLRDWEAGISPNPDVWCNKEIKFGALLEKLPEQSGSHQNTWFATGHYASKAWSDDSRPKLMRPVDNLKDQTYFLSAITEPGLRRALFPIGHLQKLQVREIAKQHKLPTAERRDSIGICFIGKKTHFDSFLASYLPEKPGHIINKLTGKVVGEHTGLWNYTVGQNARVPGLREKMFVAEKDIYKNAIYIVPGSTHKCLYSRSMRVRDFSWIWANTPPKGIDQPEGAQLFVKHRYRMKSAPCIVRRSDADELIIECEEPQHAITPGQIAALWDGDWCLGSGIITSQSRTGLSS